MDKLTAAYNWLWGKAPQWRRYGLIVLVGFSFGLWLGR